MQLFALSKDGEIHCLDVNTGKTLLDGQFTTSRIPDPSPWQGNSGAFIVSSGDSYMSFCTMHKQVGFTIQHSDTIRCMTISTDGHLAMGGGKVNHP